MFFSDRNFSSLFWVQFLGALNDNFYKNIVVLLITYKGVMIAGIPPESLVALAGGIFILPYVLFSPLAGELADKWDKIRLVRITKIFELLVMLVAAIGFLTSDFPLLLLVLFLMGTQSTFFGPVKYSILPEIVSDSQLTEANAYVESGTFLAILIGSVAGSYSSSFESAALWATAVVFFVSAIGIGFSYRLKGSSERKATRSDRIQFHPFKPVLLATRTIFQNKILLQSVLGVSWFWFFGAAILSVLPVYVRDHLRASEEVVSGLLLTFTLGIGLGSLMCSQFSGTEWKLKFSKNLEIRIIFQALFSGFNEVVPCSSPTKNKTWTLGLVPLGAVGMSIFLYDLYWISPDVIVLSEPSRKLLEVLSTLKGLRVFFDFLGLCIFSGIYTVPLYTAIQLQSPPSDRSRIIAGNNILNSFYMVISSGLIILSYKLGLGFQKIFLCLSVLNLANCGVFWFKRLNKYKL